MGDFSYTCAISRLPIGGGNAVRYLLLTENPYHCADAGHTCYTTDRWFPRTFPVQGTYDEYGRVKQVADGPQKDIWMDGLKLDMIHRETGNNPYHDAATTRSMPFEELPDALHGGRLQVTRDFREDITSDMPEVEKIFFKRKVPKGVATRKRVAKAVAKCAYLCKPGDSYMINTIRYGEVRVRWEGHGSNWDAQEKMLKPLQALLPQYATMIRTGVTPSQNAAELIVSTRPGTEGYMRSPHKDLTKKPLGVAQVMIREDVWQALCAFPQDGFHRYDCPSSLAAYRDTINGIWEKMGSLPERRMSRRLKREDLTDYRKPGSYIIKNLIPFTVGLGTHWDLMWDRKPDEQEQKSFLSTVAEFAYIQSLLGSLRFQWAPGTSTGPQSGDWEAHVTYHEMMLSLSKQQDAAQKAREARYA